MNTRKYKILVPVTKNEASIHALDMAYLLSTKIPCEITALYLVGPDEFQSVEEYHKGMLEIVEKKIQPELKHAQQWNAFKRSIRILFSGYEDSRAVKIADTVSEDAFDFVVMWMEPPDKHLLGAIIPYKNTAQKVFSQLNCPMITCMEAPSAHFIRKIVLPIDDESDTFKKLKYTLPFARAFGACICMLVVTDDDSEGEKEWLAFVRNYLRKQGIKAVIKVLNHGKVVDTVLAYASVINADLISNGFSDSESYDDIGQEHIPKRIMLRSHIPTFNFYYNQ